MKKGRLQSKDLPDRRVLEIIHRLAFADGDGIERWVMIWDLERELGGPPRKLVRAKCQRLIDRKLLDGCTCGCRGDLELTTEGHRFLVSTAS